MKTFTAKTAIRGLACSASALALVLSGSAFAQDAEEPDGIDLQDAPETEEEVILDENADGTPTENAGAIVVTGSRIKRDTYNSISPLQVLTTERANAAGLFDPSQILQRSESAAGQQIDATFQGFVLDNGPGSQQVNLRGLGADRTLLLINGRRLAPAGVEGAPTTPSINLLPAILTERNDILLDGASSVYGSDAIAGVINVVLRKDFDGLELEASGDINPEGGGDDYRIGAAYGFNTDRAFIGIGAEYDYTDYIRLNDRDFFSGCDTNREIDQDGNILTVGLRDNALVQRDSGGTISISESECKVAGISGRIFNPFTRLGSIYFQPGAGNIPNLPDFAENTDAFGDPVDRNGDGIRDVDFQNVNTNGADLTQVFQSQQERYNVFAYGEYVLPGAGNLTPYFEASYSRADVVSDNSGAGQVFPSVPDLNAFNPCNFVSNPNGVDCRDADNQFQGFVPGSPFAGFALSTGFPTPVTPITSIQGDRDNFDTTLEQYRGVIGLKGDLAFIGPNWTFDTYFSYSRADGSSTRRGIREDKLALSLGLDPTAEYGDDGIVDNDGDGIADDYDNNVDVFGFFGDPQFIGECNGAGLANPDLAAPDLLAGCVPVNLFAPSVLGQPIGSFATQAEADYLFGVRDFDTRYEQLVFNAFATGDLFELQGGSAAAVVGVEVREDKIDSQPNFVASNGLLFGFFVDRGAVGSKLIKEAFAEVDLPLVAGKPFVEELTVNLSGRVTDEEFYGTNFTYSAKGGWRPIESLLLKLSYGTSFRAPNLRENFLLGQSGFQTLFDPCAVPDVAFIAATGTFDPTLDDRGANIIANCIREGRDPTEVGIAQNRLSTDQFSSTQIFRQGSLDIDPETSRSITAGFAFEETFGDGYDVSIGANYFDIKVKDAVVELSSQFALFDCFTREDGTRSPFCDLLEFGTAPSTAGLITNANPIFLNQDQESVRGIDINTTFGKEVIAFGTTVDLGLNVRANHLIERSSLFIDDQGNDLFDDDAGEFGLAKWTGTATFTADIDDFRFTVQGRYVGPVEQDEDGIDPFSDAFGNGPDGLPAFNDAGAGPFFSDTCTGGGSADGVVPGDGVFCRDIGFADSYVEVATSIRYRNDGLTLLAGVSNIFDETPPLVDSAQVLAISNVAIGNGYNYNGREFFFQVRKEF
ncbi:MAG: TonB-dependent receptor [Parerythrobacter sp.]